MEGEMFAAGGTVSAVGAGGVADIMGHQTSKINSTILGGFLQLEQQFIL